MSWSIPVNHRWTWNGPPTATPRLFDIGRNGYHMVASTSPSREMWPFSPVANSVASAASTWSFWGWEKDQTCSSQSISEYVLFTSFQYMFMLSNRNEGIFFRNDLKYLDSIQYLIVFHTFQDVRMVENPHRSFKGRDASSRLTRKPRRRRPTASRTSQGSLGCSRCHGGHGPGNWGNWMRSWLRVVLYLSPNYCRWWVSLTLH